MFREGRHGGRKDRAGDVHGTERNGTMQQAARCPIVKGNLQLPQGVHTYLRHIALQRGAVYGADSLLAGVNLEYAREREGAHGEVQFVRAPVVDIAPYQPDAWRYQKTIGILLPVQEEQLQKVEVWLKQRCSPAHRICVQTVSVAELRRCRIAEGWYALPCNVLRDGIPGTWQELVPMRMSKVVDHWLVVERLPSPDVFRRKIVRFWDNKSHYIQWEWCDDGSNLAQYCATPAGCPDSVHRRPVSKRIDNVPQQVQAYVRHIALQRGCLYLPDEACPDPDRKHAPEGSPRVPGPVVGMYYNDADRTLDEAGPGDITLGIMLNVSQVELLELGKLELVISDRRGASYDFVAEEFTPEEIQRCCIAEGWYALPCNVLRSGVPVGVPRAQHDVHVVCKGRKLDHCKVMESVPVLQRAELEVIGRRIYKFWNNRGCLREWTCRFSLDRGTSTAAAAQAAESDDEAEHDEEECC